MGIISKSDFILFLNCKKSLWLLKNKPEKFVEGESSNFEKRLSAQGEEVERYVLKLFEDRRNFKTQIEFKTQDGLYSKADITEYLDDDSINIYEIKSTISIKTGPPHDQIKDAAFQTIVAEQSGKTVKDIFIIHLNKEYIKKGEIKPKELLVLSNQTENVRKIIPQTRNEINAAQELIKNQQINEQNCSCLYSGKSNHCDNFKYFNKQIPEKSFYLLPRIHKNKIKTFVNENRYNLDLIREEEVSENQALVLESYKKDQPIVNREIINNFFSIIEYPLHFLDYETFNSAIPLLDRTSPHAHIPFQFSIHKIVDQNHVDNFSHNEYLSEELKLPEELINKLEQCISPSGSIISWNKSFENTRNKEMGELFPSKQNFLSNLNDRTIDIADIFKNGYVDIEFEGSISLKKVLPVFIPELSYENLEVSGGTDAMLEWFKMLETKHEVHKKKIRKNLLKYCELDTLAMVKIFQKLKNYIK